MATRVPYAARRVLCTTIFKNQCSLQRFSRSAFISCLLQRRNDDPWLRLRCAESVRVSPRAICREAATQHSPGSRSGPGIPSPATQLALKGPHNRPACVHTPIFQYLSPYTSFQSRGFSFRQDDGMKPDEMVWMRLPFPVSFVRNPVNPRAGAMNNPEQCRETRRQASRAGHVAASKQARLPDRTVRTLKEPFGLEPTRRNGNEATGQLCVVNFKLTTITGRR